MHIRRPTVAECIIAGLLGLGVVALILDWKHTLGVVAIGCLLAVAVTTIVALPSFVVFLCLDWSIVKAARKTGFVAHRCLEFVGDIVAQL